ncbi:hypothetical protein CROQUDRAFT_43155 [Cronartium quercuum f. sp. fusiforme G11]|uniref:Association with the SNF1 complex (ASC) domain-containing protein n=1 Tax=Cronartium quercuum f. sp. fusiforme G11 TaxID=708437 RepID=A0A9P6NND3_9BASI|nr:hypothetical protein CROQUDRAFT_43155 [Cronartium quercuum f. sp. fusiforme G11]
MGNNASTVQSSTQSYSQSRKRIAHSTAAASLSSFNTTTHHHPYHPNPNPNPTQITKSHKKPSTQPNLGRRRKSLELPDHAPKRPPSSTTFQDLAQFQLKLPDRAHHSPTLHSTTSSSSISAGALTGIEAMRLDSGDDFTPHPPPTALLNLSSATATVDPGEPPEDEPNPTHIIPVSTTVIKPDQDTLNAGLVPPLFNVSPASLPPLQQPLETVVPPLPPAILQTLPPELDSPLPSSSTLTTAVTESVAAATAVVQASPALDIGAGSQGVPTLITWNEPAQEVYVTGTFSKWKQQIKLQKPLGPSTTESGQPTNFSALVSLPPGPHRLKFIVDERWKTSKELPSATDDKGNLINYLQINPGDAPFRGLGPRGIWSGYAHRNWSSLGPLYDERLDLENMEESLWTNSIPDALIAYEDYHESLMNDDEIQENDHQSNVVPLPGDSGFAAEPPKLPAQLKEGILNLASRLPEGQSDDNSLLPKPDHSVLNHLAASPIKQGLLSVGVTSRYKRKYLTTVYYKPVDL